MTNAQPYTVYVLYCLLLIMIDEHFGCVDIDKKRTYPVL